MKNREANYDTESISTIAVDHQAIEGTCLSQ